MNKVWDQLNEEARKIGVEEALLSDYVTKCILEHNSFESALSFILANKLSDNVMSQTTLKTLFSEIFDSSPLIIQSSIADIQAVFDRDPAICTFLSVILHLKGYQSIQVHRLANFLWKNNRQELALFIQSRNSEVFTVDIHPACEMGNGIMFCLLYTSPSPRDRG